MKWTEAQKRAIEAKGTGVLATAAAGSGKTAVLTERCVRAMVRLHPPAPAENFLVVTFTEAAAAQMRSKIADALLDRLDALPPGPGAERAWIFRQIQFLGAARISTIHGWFRRLIADHGRSKGISPDFEVIPEEEAALMRQDALDAVLEERYRFRDGRAGLDADFARLLAAFGGDGGDGGLRGLILSLDNHARTGLDPTGWLKGLARSYHEADGEEKLAGTPWARPFIVSILRKLEQAGETIDVMESVGESLCDAYLDDARTLQTILAPLTNGLASALDLLDNDPGKLGAALKKIPPVPALPNLPRIGKAEREDMDPADADLYKKLRESAKQTLAKTAAPLDLLRSDPLAGLDSTRWAVDNLISLALDFHDAFREAKQRRNGLDFHDLEQLAAELTLEKTEDGRFVPTPLARSLQEEHVQVLVDEYQDVNPIQHAVLMAVSRPDARFLVGDVKQSIYGFRLAEPGLLTGLANKARAGDEKTDGILVPLRENFRSREPILAAVNAVMDRLMTESLGGVNYAGDEHRLIRAAEYAGATPEMDAPVELILVKTSARKDAGEEKDGANAKTALKGADLEALAAARRILELMGRTGNTPLPVVASDGPNPTIRPVRYGDIVILLRAAAGQADVFRRTLEEADIPCFAQTARGFLDAPEIVDAVNFLAAADNPLQDVPLTALFRSPFGEGWGIGPQELFDITLATSPDAPLYERVRRFSQGRDRETAGLRARAKTMIGRIDEWREEARAKPLSVFLWKAFRDARFIERWTAHPSGRQKAANLRRLHDMAVRFENGAEGGLGRFLRQLDVLKNEEQGLDQAPALGEADDVVRIMTVHQSKGLQFPVVLLPQMGRDILRGGGAALFADRELGVATHGVNFDKRRLFPTLALRAIQEARRKKEREEELRLLYVAMTRARERLVLIGPIPRKDTPEDWGRASLLGGKWKALFHPARAVKTLDWILPALALSMPGEEWREDGTWWGTGPFRMKIEDPASAAPGPARPDEAETHQRQNLLDLMTRRLPFPDDMPLPAPEEMKEIERRVRLMTAEPPGGDLARIPGKRSVSELKRRWERLLEDEKEDVAPAQPEPLMEWRERGRDVLPDGRRIGVAVHALLENIPLDLEMTLDSLRRERDRLTGAGFIDAEAAPHLPLDAALWLLDGPLGKKMRADPARALREVPFTVRLTGLPLGENGAPVQEPVIVQGVIDCLIEEEDGYVLVDYKTDRVSPGEAGERARTRYAAQIDHYRKAVAALDPGKPVKEAWLAFLHCRTLIPMRG